MNNTFDRQISIGDVLEFRGGQAATACTRPEYGAYEHSCAGEFEGQPPSHVRGVGVSIFQGILGGRVVKTVSMPTEPVEPCDIIAEWVKAVVWKAEKKAYSNLLLLLLLSLVAFGRGGGGALARQTLSRTESDERRTGKNATKHCK